MEIKFSRHAKRRAKLYHLSESTIITLVESSKLEPGKLEIIKEIAGNKYPIKIVVDVEGDQATIISNYPCKKGRKL